MRRFPIAILLALVVTIPVAARQDPRVMRMGGGELSNGAIERYEARMKLLSAMVKRDAFIVAQLVKGSGELKDFQKNAAVSRALDRVNAAILRAGEDPPASPTTMTALGKVLDHLKHAREQGAMADLPSEQSFIFEQTHFIHYELFRELDAARKERQALADYQARLQTISQDLDGAMMDALGSTFDFIRAGGK